MSLGGWSETKPANGEVRMLCEGFWNISESKTGQKYQEFNAIEYRSQVVAGINYLIKVQVGKNDYVHLLIFQSPLLETKFEGVQGDHKLEDPLVPFEPFSEKTT
ncbi:hypothetical protein CRENBAI_019674 [Crenichthys baileyi]|uniref:Cystatin-B n=1 Tax=Crenichthys baileyi TaxID=28760 RepID=A0AAV9R7J4_9TELE